MTDDIFSIQMTSVVDQYDGPSGTLGSPIQSGWNKSSSPPIGVFWDIENCQVPKNKSAFDVVHLIRERYFKEHREAEFICVCDVNKESKDIINELNSAQVVVVHIDAMCKNAADIKLRQCMQKFADIHSPPATIVLISGDVNFAPDLSDFRYRRQFTIIVIHNGMANVSLLACAHEEISFSELTATLNNRSSIKHKNTKELCKLVVTNLPTNQKCKYISQRLERLSENCGGKVASIEGNLAILYFPSPDATKRARKRMDNEDVYGNQISVNFPSANEPNRKRNVSCSKDRKSISAHQPSRPHSNPLPNRPLDPSPYVGNKTILHNKDANSHSEYNRLKKLLEPNLRSCDSNNVGSEYDGYGDHAASCWSGSSVENCDGSANVHLWGNQATNQIDSFYAKESLTSGQRRSRGTTNGDAISAGADGFALQKDAMSYNRSWMLGPSTSRRSTPSPNMDYSRNTSSNGIGRYDLNSTTQSDGEAVELQISNLDSNIDVKQLKHQLLTMFREHVVVLHIYVTLNIDGNISAGVKVPSMNDAQYAISKLHRTRLGAKRISIAVASSLETIPLSTLKSDAVDLLLDVPTRRLQLFKFRELYEKRYHRSIGVAELHRLKDVISIHENVNGKMVVLNPDIRRFTSSPACSESSREVQEILEKSHCDLHTMKDDGKGWAEKEQASQLPTVIISHQILTANVHDLLHLHGNCISLNSFPTCYQCVFGNFNVSDGGVPLEHLVTIVPGVQIVRNSSGIKILERVNATKEQSEPRGVSPPLASQLSLLCREIVDLLKNQPGCRIPFTKFIPAYHHHFGRQCRVADYGYTRLLDLLEAIPHVIQILGDGNKRILTLTHRAQVKRFNADLLRILKSQVSKEVALKDFPEIYLKCIGKEFNVVNYGVCDIMEMLNEVAEGAILVTGSNDDLKIQLPKREQSLEEAERTKQFKLEAMELLRNSPRCRMGFTKFIPAYHHHFSKQCRVADYGFTKLIELFEAIPEAIEVKPSDEDGEDRILQLVQPELVAVFSEQIASLMRGPGRHIMTLEKLLKAYIQQNGYSIYPEDYDAADVVELLEMIDVVKVTEAPGGVLVTLTATNHNFHLVACVKKLLLDFPDGKLALRDFLRILNDEYNLTYDIDYLCCSLGTLIKVEGFSDDRVIRINTLELFKRDVVQLLHSLGGRVLLANFDEAYIERYSRPCVPAQYGYRSLASLLQSVQDVATFKGRLAKRALVLNTDVASSLHIYGEREQSSRDAPVAQKHQIKSLVPAKSETCSSAPVMDLMNDPIPIRIPSPILLPQLVSQSEQLIRLDSPVPETNGRDLFDNSPGVMNVHETLSLNSLNGHDQDSCCYATSSLCPLPLYQSCFSPASSMLPPVPSNWKHQSPTVATSPPIMNFPTSMAGGITHTSNSPTASITDFSEMVMNTPPYIRELIATSSPESTPTKTPSFNKVLPRIAAQFSNPLSSLK